MIPQPPIVLPTEFALAVECCRAGFRQAEGARLEEYAAKADWERFVRLVRRHRIEALAWHALQVLGLPADVGGKLAADARRIAEQGLRSAAESAVLRDRLRATGIDCLFVKGLTLGKLAYVNPFVKMGWDIDLLVDPTTVEAVADVLRSLGYELLLPAKAADLGRWHGKRKESVWRKSGGTIVELHSRLADNDRLIPLINVGSPRQTVEVAPGIALPTLRTDELFAYLCVHGASSAWFRLKWISDLAGFLSGCDEAEIDRLYRRSQQLGAGRAAAQALILAHWLFETAAPALVADLDRGAARWLAHVALDQLLAEREPAERPLGTGMIHLSQLALLPGLGFKRAELGRQIGDAAGFY